MKVICENCGSEEYYVITQKITVFNRGKAKDYSEEVVEVGCPECGESNFINENGEEVYFDVRKGKIRVGVRKWEKEKKKKG